MSFINLKRQFRRKLDESIQEKANTILGGSCVDYTSYKNEIGKITGMEDAYEIFIEALKVITNKDNDDEEDEE